MALAGQFRKIGLISIVTIALSQLPGQERPLRMSVWADIYKSAWAGIYSEQQAVRGRSAYRESCAFCHGPALEGSEDAPPLAGPDFRADWDGANIADLFEKIRYTMPPKLTGALNEEQAAAILSYILKANGLPAGATALPATADQLRGVRFLAEDAR